MHWQYPGVEVPGQMAETAPAVAVLTLHGNRMTGALVPQANARDKPPHPGTGAGLDSLGSFPLGMLRIAFQNAAISSSSELPFQSFPSQHLAFIKPDMGMISGCFMVIPGRKDRFFNSGRLAQQLADI